MTAGDVWTDLGRLMRTLREANGHSLRDTEATTRLSRGMLSQYETGRARPARKVVELYDELYGGDGLPVAMFAEARGAYGPVRATRKEPIVHPSDRLVVEDTTVPYGEQVPGGELRIGWRLVNAGQVHWRERRLARVGAPAAPGLISSALTFPLPDTAPGDHVEVSTIVRVPDHLGTFVAYWDIVDPDGVPTFPSGNALRLLVHVAH